MANKFDAIFDAASRKYGVDKNLLIAQANAESSMNPNAVSPTGARGLMQIEPSNYQSLGITNPNDPTQSINGAAQLMAQNLKASGGDVAGALERYHGGTNPANWGPKTQAYVTKVQGLNSVQAFVDDMDRQYKEYNHASAPAPDLSSSPIDSRPENIAAFVAHMDDSAKQAVANEPSLMDKFGRGLAQGVHDVTEKPAELIARGLDKTGISGALGFPTEQDLKDKDARAQQSFANDYGNSTLAQVSHAGGEILGAAPMVYAGGGAGSAGLDAVGLPSVANFLTGSAGAGMNGLAGLGTRALSRAAAGGLGGALFGADMSKPGEELEAAKSGGEIGGALGLASPLASLITTPLKRAGEFIGDHLLPSGISVAVDGAQNVASKLTGGVIPKGSPALIDQPINSETSGGAPFSKNQLMSASDAIAQALAKDGMTPQQAMDAIKLRGPNATLADVGGRNVRSLAETAANTPGRGSTAADMLQTRVMNHPDQARQAVLDATGKTGDTMGTIDDLMEQRSVEARPLYEKAFAGGSIAPLHAQLAAATEDATAREIAAQNALAAADEARSVNVDGVPLNSDPTAYLKARKDLKAAQADKAAISGVLNQAQSDMETNAPGAIWSPRIQQFLDDPIARQGLAKGIATQRVAALKNGEYFDPTEYAVTGTDEAGNPIVGKVPNMRTLDAMKGGLDDILETYRDKVTGKLNLDKLGNEVNGARISLLNELDRLNPDYAAARLAYAGRSQAIDAVSMGKRALSVDSDVTGKMVSAMTPANREFYLEGVTRALQNKIAAANDGSNVAGSLFANDQIRSRIRAAFPNQDAYDKFAESMNNMKSEVATRNAIIGGSPTARRLAGMNADSSDNMNLVQSLLTGNPAHIFHKLGADALNGLTRPSEKRLAAQGELLFSKGGAGFNPTTTGRDADVLRNALVPSSVGVLQGHRGAGQ